MQDHVVVHRQDHFPRCGVVLLLRDEHTLRLFDQDRRKADAVLAVGADAIRKKTVQLAAKGIALRLLHGIKPAERCKGFVRQGLDMYGSHRESSLLRCFLFS